MTTSFSEFLQERAEKYKAQASQGRATIDEWRGAIERLFTQLERWLKESDPTGIIEIERSKERVREPGLGP